MVTNAQLIEETVQGLNYLSQKFETKEYKGGLVGPAASSLFLIVLLIREQSKNASLNQNVLQNYYKYHSGKNNIIDNVIINCMRHALAHDRFTFTLEFVKFETDKYGRLEIPYYEFSSLTNKMLFIYNQQIASLRS